MAYISLYIMQKMSKIYIFLLDREGGFHALFSHLNHLQRQNHSVENTETMECHTPIFADYMETEPAYIE